MKRLPALILFFSTFVALAQQQPCGTKMTSAQMEALRKFQQAGKFSISHGKTVTHIPIKFHIAGLDNGTYYYPASHLMEAVCKINRDFAPLGYHFYIKDDVDYINNTTLYHFNYSTYGPIVWQTRDPNAVNVYFVGTATGICGVYMGGDDVVVVVNACGKPGSSTLTHELGHFFGLPHTFSGWEWGTPSEFDRELADGTNCQFAGDGFCDTRADYFASRWNCPYSGTVKDPKGVAIDPDGTLFMSYSDDACMNRFSPEQLAAIDNNRISRGLATVQPVSDSIGFPTQIAPVPNDSNLNPNFLTFRWNTVPNAWAYNFQVINWKGYNQPVVDLVLSDTFIVVPQLPSRRDLYWRVKSVTPGFTCSAFSPLSVFYTGFVGTGSAEMEETEPVSSFPNPAQPGEPIRLNGSPTASISVHDLSGRAITFRYSAADQTLSIGLAGSYIITVIDGDHVSHVRQVVVN